MNEKNENKESQEKQSKRYYTRLFEKYFWQRSNDGTASCLKFDVVHESTEDDASIVIINTCGFIDNAKQESIDTILTFAKAKEKGKIDKLIVTGCLSERYKPDLVRKFPT